VTRRFHVTTNDDDVRLRFVTAFYSSSIWVFQMSNISITGVARGEDVWSEDFSGLLDKGYNRGQLDMAGVERWSLQLPRMSHNDALAFVTVLYSSSDRQHAVLYAGGLPDVAYWQSEDIAIANTSQPVQVSARFTNERLTALDEDWISLSVR
jgi:hypothetical protein